MQTIYKHTADVHHSDSSPEQIVPTLKNIFSPKSVIDIGCGVGNFLREFVKNDISDIRGVDGEWADLKEIENNIGQNNFVSFNLNNVYNPNKKYDLAISLEVAEHIDKLYADNFVQTLVNCSDNIVFSAAIPLQGGQNHINEQWNEYWVEKFEKHGYKLVDFLKPYFWDNDNIFWWYKQNILFFTKTPDRFTEFKINKLTNPVHKELFALKVSELEVLRKRNIQYTNLLESQKNWKYNLKYLLKSIIK
ncbi:methyltransferase domain-containing protein [Chryseobacterium sp.]|uniref:methyltransferase domain-containing protein n=1 Tax=Chryseobacterium sp. TaxID=1871047 RepID=UPI00289A8A6C|nr:methyltransferase domain-containing protein [Chryseobacterium sp.]